MTKLYGSLEAGTNLFVRLVMKTIMLWKIQFQQPSQLRRLISVLNFLKI